jgi:hypothetical protein
MLINDSQQLVKTSFDGEAEIESVVQKYAEQLFGSSIIYLPQTRISTLGGKNTIPDAIVIDIQSEEWFIVEAERAVHGTWEHIAPQVSRQLASAWNISWANAAGVRLMYAAPTSTNATPDFFKIFKCYSLSVTSLTVVSTGSNHPSY